MQNFSPSSNPKTLWVGYASVFATLMAQALMSDPALACQCGTLIAQSLPSSTSSPAALSTLTFDFSHPFSPQTVSQKTEDLSDRPAPSHPPETKELYSNHAIATLDFTFPIGLAVTTLEPHASEQSPRKVMHYTDANASYKTSSSSSSAPRSAERQSRPVPLSLDTLFSGNSNSLIAISIGSAEGTRSPDGGKTWAYNGHTDPGNGVWNMGTFSWQHGASSPEEADRKQLARLRKQAIALTNKAEEMGIPWGLEEQLNALDLANQSPSAALNPGGYIDRLKEAQLEGLEGSDAILWARTWSYRHPSGTRWNAPGLGNTHHGIRIDQKRRQDAIKAAIAHYFD